MFLKLTRKRNFFIDSKIVEQYIDILFFGKMVDEIEYGFCSLVKANIDGADLDTEIKANFLNVDGSFKEC